MVQADCQASREAKVSVNVFVLLGRCVLPRLLSLLYNKSTRHSSFSAC
jgi:hypothetical protein